MHLGANVSILPDCVAASLPANRRGALISDILEVLRTGALAPSQAAKLRGRLGFAQSLMFGRFGRVLLQPPTNRQYSPAIRGRHLLNGELRDVLPWWVATLRSCAERRTWFHGARPVVVYVDAAGCGHLGATVFVDGEQYTFSTHVPEWPAESPGDIYDFEMCASLFGLCIVAGFLPNRTVIL